MSQKQIVQINPPKLSSWQRQLSDAITDPAELAQLLSFNLQQIDAIAAASKNFKLLVPRAYLAKINPLDPNDPLLQQMLPVSKELTVVFGYSKDPLQETTANPVPGLLHKYASRALLTITNACSINCRYCFRRHFAYQDNRLTKENIQNIIAYLTANPDINEVILSGGDPLIATDYYLARLTEQLTNIPHIKRLRIHSRLPIMIPERITDELIAWFAHPHRQNILVLHCNHPNELDNNTEQAMKKLRQAGITLLNQSVLLKGVNNQVAILAQLSEKLFSMGILPYYLHLLDKVTGAAHFDLPRDEALALYRELQTQLPGFLLPKLTHEEAGKKHKTLLV